MCDELKNPTTNSEINDLLRQLLLQAQSILMNQFVGMYIGGSLATNHFSCETSDIDCYVITTNVLSENMIHQLKEMHHQFYSSKFPYAKKIEASYIPQGDLSNFETQSVRPYFNEGTFYLAHYGSNFEIELYVLREKGITIVGPDIKHLIKKISHQHLRLAIYKNLDEYWKTTVNDLSKLGRSDYQVFAILTMCRTLYSLKTGYIASKTEAAKWATNNLESHWESLIRQALAWRPGQELNKVGETQQFIRYILDKSCHDES